MRRKYLIPISRTSSNEIMAGCSCMSRKKGANSSSTSSTTVSTKYKNSFPALTTTFGRGDSLTNRNDYEISGVNGRFSKLR